MTLVKSKSRAKISTSQRKRAALHHRKGRSYVKSYWPYIPLIAIFVLGGLISNSLSPKSSVLGSVASFSNSSFLSTTNANRSENNEPGLSLNSALESAAQAKANDMVKNNYWSHNTPSGQTPYSFISAAGYNYQLAGENLAYGFSNAKSVVIGWMNSPEHRANILNKNYQDVGFGVASSPNYIGKGPEVVVVAMYAHAVSGSVTTITFNAPPPSGVLGASTGATVSKDQPPISLVSRIQLLTGGRAIWSLSVLSFITGILICLFIIRHSRKIKKIIKGSEKFVAKHYALDVILCLLITAGYVLTRTSGVIR
ncbi:MAG TPA: CAP domain-containing protein [Candidatus Saccharimonadales bacterium]